MQVMNSATGGADVRKYNGVIDCVKQTIQKEGIIRGLYRGQTSLLVREIPGNFMWYGVYEAVCKYYCHGAAVPLSCLYTWLLNVNTA